MSKTKMPDALKSVLSEQISEAAVKHFNMAVDGEQWAGRTSTIVVTEECNLRCTYCYCTKTPDRMSWDTAKKYIDVIFEKCKHYADIPLEAQSISDHRKIFEFVGGEPLLEAELMFKCIDYIDAKVASLPPNHPWARKDWPCICGQNHSHGYKYQISTNGVLLLDKNIQNELLIRKHRRQWDDYIGISCTLDGTQEMHDKCRVTVAGGPSWQDVMDARAWMEVHFPVNVKTTKSTIAHENVGFVAEIIKFFYDIGMTTVAQNCVFENVWHEGDQLILFDQLCKAADFMLEDKKYEKFYVRWFDPRIIGKRPNGDSWCGGGSNMDACDYTGTVYPCLRFKTVEKNKPWPMGNTETWKDEEIVSFFQNCKFCPEAQKELTGLDCEECPVSILCSDCKALTYDYFGRVDIKAPYLCPMHKAVVCANLYFFGKLFNTEVDKDYLLYLLAEWTKDDHFSVKYNDTSVDGGC